MTALVIAVAVMGLLYLTARKVGWKWVAFGVALLAAGFGGFVYWSDKESHKANERYSTMAYVTPHVYATHFSAIDEKGILRFDVLVFREPRYRMSMDDITAGKPDLRPIPYGEPGLIAEVPVRVHCKTDTYYFDEGRYFGWADFSKNPTRASMPALVATDRIAGMPEDQLAPLVRVIPDSMDATKPEIIYAACRNAGPDAEAQVDALIKRARSGIEDSTK